MNDVNTVISVFRVYFTTVFTCCCIVATVMCRGLSSPLSLYCGVGLIMCRGLSSPLSLYCGVGLKITSAASEAGSRLDVLLFFLAVSLSEMFVPGLVPLSFNTSA